MIIIKSGESKVTDFLELVLLCSLVFACFGGLAIELFGGELKNGLLYFARMLERIDEYFQVEQRLRPMSAIARNSLMWVVPSPNLT